MKFFKKSKKTLKYIEKLALENVENKKRITELEKKLDFALKQVATLENDIDNAGNIDERLTSMENSIHEIKNNDFVVMDDLEDNVRYIVQDMIPRNIEDVCDVYDSYDFDEFVCRDDLDEFVTEEDVCNAIQNVLHDKIEDALYDYVKKEDWDKRNYEAMLENWQNPDMFMKFLNKLAKYIVTQTNETT